MNTGRRCSPGRLRARGVISLMAVLFLLTVIAAVLATTLTMTASDVLDSSAHSRSVEALLLAESGVERAVSRFASATVCGGLGESVTHGGGSIAISVALAQEDFAGGALPANQCRITVTGATLFVDANTERTVDAVIERGDPISFVASSSNAGGGGAVSSLTIARPAGLVADDVMLAQINVRANICGAGGNTPPAGWVLVANGCLNSGTALSQAVYYKVAGASEPAGYTWSFTSGRASGGIAAFREVNSVTPIDVAGGQANASSTNIVAPSVTTTFANTMLVGLFGLARADAISPPAGMTEAYDRASGGGPNGATSEAAYAAQAAIGATGTRTAVGGAAAVTIGHLVALRPAGSARVLGWREVVR